MSQDGGWAKKNTLEARLELATSTLGGSRATIAPHEPSPKVADYCFTICMFALLLLPCENTPCDNNRYGGVYSMLAATKLSL
jgi:hypothetical protein